MICIHRRTIRTHGSDECALPPQNRRGCKSAGWRCQGGIYFHMSRTSEGSTVPPFFAPPLYMHNCWNNRRHFSFCAAASGGRIARIASWRSQRPVLGALTLSVRLRHIGKNNIACPHMKTVQRRCRIVRSYALNPADRRPDHLILAHLFQLVEMVVMALLAQIAAKLRPAIRQRLVTASA